MSTSPSLTVSHWPARLVGVLGILVFSFFAVLSWVFHSFWAILFIVLALVSIPLILLYGRTTMSQRGITHSAPLGRYALDWDEVRAVVIDKGGSTIVFQGEDKQLVLPAFSFWAGRDKTAMMGLLGQELKQRGIKISERFASFALSRHTRVTAPPGQGQETVAIQQDTQHDQEPAAGQAGIEGGHEVSTDQAAIEPHLEYLNSLRKPALGLRASAVRRLSKIGGLPNLPADWPWPEWRGRPLSFLCQLDLSELPCQDSMPELPRAGCLYFFYDYEQSTWGFDPQDKGSWQVLYTPGDVRACPAREAPPQSDRNTVFGERFIVPVLIYTYPGWQDERVYSLNFTDDQLDAYMALCASVFEDRPAHHLFGYPSPVQGNDMDLECQLVSNGLYCGDLSGYQDDRAKKLAPGRTDWIPLLQLDTDDETGMMWGDDGMLYFWIKQDDLKARRFENCWMILQCY